LRLHLAAPAVITAGALVLVGQCGAVTPMARMSGAPSSGTGPSAAAGDSRYAAARSEPRKDPYYPAKGTTGVDALHYRLDLTWDDASRDLSGTATIVFRATRDESDVSLDLGKPLTAGAVALDGIDVGSQHRGNKLRIDTGALHSNSRHTLAITYHGKPSPASVPATRRDLAHVGWTTTSDDEAWALQEPFGAFTWYPVNDHPSDKAFYDVTVHTKSAWHGISNGELVSDTVVNGERTMRWHLASPAASYLITIDIGPYREYRQSGPGGLPLTYWVRDQDHSTLRTLRRTPAMLRWLEARLGRYPFDRLGDVVAPNHSGEETQTIVSIDPHALPGPFGRATLVHEYSHQWFGDDVTPNNWKDLWLNESFAMYVQIRWEIAHGNETNARWRRYLNKRDQRLRTNDGPPGEYDRNKFASLNVYYCGARMLDRIYQRLGSKRFWSLLRGWPRQHHFGNADRKEWIHYLDRRTGHNYGRFVHRWLDDKKSPR
jgi:aminopeptidase N